MQEDLINAEKYLTFCDKILKIAEDSKNEEYKLFLVGVLAYSLEYCGGILLKDYSCLKFIIKYSLFVLDRKYVNMMLEFQIIELIQKISPGINFMNLMKKKNQFNNFLIEAEKMKEKSGVHSAYDFLQNKLAENVKIENKDKGFVEKANFEGNVQNNKESSDIEEDPIEKNLLFNQFEADYEILMKEEEIVKDQSYKKTFIFQKHKLENTADVPHLIVKTQKSKIIAKPLESNWVVSRK